MDSGLGQEVPGTNSGFLAEGLGLWDFFVISFQDLGALLYLLWF